MSDPTTIIQAHGLTKTFARGSEQVHAVENASFELFEGELVALLGPSGSGKTTILNLLCGWEEPDAGSIHWAGSSHHGALGSLGWDQIALLPQTHGLLNELSIGDNVSLPSRLGSLSVEAGRAEALLEDFGLAQLADRSPQEVSLGEQQRAALARALVGRPRLLLADEPSGHQDAVWAGGVLRALRKACAEGTMCLVATHNQEILGFVDRILEMRDGKIVAADVPEGRETEAPH
jgi:putative ABC transport system ATP-binding protein